MKTKNKMTIEDLAALTQKGFVEVRTEMRDGFEAVDKRFKVVESDLGKLKNDMIFLKADMVLERADSREIKENAQKLLEKLDHFATSSKKEEQERVMLVAQVRRLEERVTKLETKKK